MQRGTRIKALSVATTALLACGGSTSTEMGHDSGAGGSSGQGSGQTDSGVGSGSTTDAAFPLGKYDMCMLSDEPNTLGGGLGEVSVSSEHGVIVVRFADDGGAPGTLDFSQTSSTSVSLSSSKQQWVGPWAWCGGGVTPGGGIADPTPATGTLDIESGMATFNGGTLFITVAGTVAPADGGGCSTGPLSAAITCTKD